jgi:hypothetical protein
MDLGSEQIVMIKKNLADWASARFRQTAFNAA